MNRLFRTLPILLFGVLLLGNTDRNSTKLYRGEWFDIRYPASFKATATDEKNGATFRSPDNAVTFYIFSPQWNGEPSWLGAMAGETVQDSTQTIKDGIATTRVTYRSTDGRLRSIEDVENRELNARSTFGIAYRDEATLKKYRNAYLAFKRSLRQYAD